MVSKDTHEYPDNDHPPPVLDLAIWGLALLLAGAPDGAHANPIAPSAWHVQQIGTRHVPLSAGLALQFAEAGRLAGFGGCNHFFGSYRVDGLRITIGPTGMTMMACEPSISAREARFMEALKGVRSFVRRQSRLTLYGPAHALRVRLIVTSAD